MEQATCPIHGGPRSECVDEDKDWFPQRDICRPSMQLAAARALYAKLHDKAPYHDGSFTAWAAERSHKYPFHYLDGVTIRLAETDENPDDKFLDVQVRGHDLPEQDAIAANPDAVFDETV